MYCSVLSWTWNIAKKLRTPWCLVASARQATRRWGLQPDISILGIQITRNIPPVVIANTSTGVKTLSCFKMSLPTFAGCSADHSVAMDSYLSSRFLDKEEGSSTALSGFWIWGLENGEPLVLVFVAYTKPASANLIALRLFSAGLHRRMKVDGRIYQFLSCTL